MNEIVSYHQIGISVERNKFTNTNHEYYLSFTWCINPTELIGILISIQADGLMALLSIHQVGIIEVVLAVFVLLMQF